MRLFLVAMLVAGAALLAAIVANTDLAEVGERLLQIGWGGVIVIVAVHALGYVGLAVSWLYAIPGASMRDGAAHGLYHLWKMLMVGTALDLAPVHSIPMA